MIELGRALGMTVTCWTRRRSPERERELGAPLVDLHELFGSSDVVSLHLAHRPETEGIVDRNLLALLPPQAILVNTARGALVDERALVELLENGGIRGAEPPPEDHPLVPGPRAVLRPHVGFHTAEASGQLLRISLENLIAFARASRRTSGSQATAIASISTRQPTGSPTARVARAGGTSPAWRRYTSFMAWKSPRLVR